MSLRTSVPTAAFVVVISAMTGGLVGGRVFATPPDDHRLERYQSFTTALATVENEYVDKVDSEQLVKGAIDGMLRTLDPHSSYFTPKEYAQMRERQEGSYYGLGITIVAIDGDITITSLFEGSPAYRAGIRRGDVIAKVVGASTKGWTTDQAVLKLKGPKGTTVNISIRRTGMDDLIDLTVARDEIHITTVRTAFMLAPGTGYVRLQDFSETSDHELSDALKKLSTAGMERLVLDLRDNPGGPLDQAIAVANHFLKRGQPIVSTKGRTPESNEQYVALEPGDYPDVPLIVLVSRGTASASEIVSGAMQDHDRGLIVGEQTWGKALVQSVYRLVENAGLALTTGHYQTPSGRVIQRPWDAGFDEYLTYQLRDQTGKRDHPASDLHYTDGGRKVYGGGGIEPDHFMAGPIEGFSPSPFARALVSRGMFVGMAEHFTAEGDTRPANRGAGARHKVAKGFEITPADLDEFKQYVTSQHMRIDEAAFAADLAFIKAEMHYEIDVDLFGVEEGRRNLSRVDPQLQYALGFFDEAKQLLQLGKKTPGR
jgi:carboxyl-terminal processing protease